MNHDRRTPALLSGAALLVLAASHWLQLPEPAMTAMVGLLGGAATLYFVNSRQP